MSDFIEHHVWTEGPKFLWKFEQEWPKTHFDPALEVDDRGVHKRAVVNMMAGDSLNLSDHLICYFSDWQKQKRSVAWFLKLKSILLNLSQMRK